MSVDTNDWRQVGGDWARRNPRTVEALDALYLRRTGVTRSLVNRQLLEGVPRSARVLEVGSSAGVQLDGLRQLGFYRTFGVDLSHEALRMNPHRPAAADALALPFRDRAFDLVLTSGTLIHVRAEVLPDAMAEIARVSRRWVMGVEYWRPKRYEFRVDGVLPPFWGDDYQGYYQQLGLRSVSSAMLQPQDGGCWLQAFLVEHTGATPAGG